MTKSTCTCLMKYHNTPHNIAYRYLNSVMESGIILDAFHPNPQPPTLPEFCSRFPFFIPSCYVGQCCIASKKFVLRNDLSTHTTSKVHELNSQFTLIYILTIFIRCYDTSVI